jgi:hypothetical protein
MPIPTMTSYDLEKWIWTEEDFPEMGWHDATIYGFRLEGDFTLDIDYIFQWNKPEIEGFFFTFWAAPSTLIFTSPTNISFELTQSFSDKWLEIDDIEMVIVDGKKQWTIITQQGEISFISAGYRQVVRRAPSFQIGQSIAYDERGGFSFDTVPGNLATYELGPI